MSVQLRSPADAVQWLQGRNVTGLQSDSRRVQPGEAFVAWPGAATDGRRHVPNALAQGAHACLVEQSGIELFDFDEKHVAAYSGLKAACGPIAADWYGNASESLDVVAITGTNGKTSTAWWLAQALGRVRIAAGAGGCSVVGTLGAGVPPQLIYTGLTTPDPITLQHALRQFADAGLSACAVEASSIGIVERRLDGTRIAVAVFTNFTQDHLDYHGSMDAYWQAKAELFRWPGLRAAVVNIDDVHGRSLIQQLAARGDGPEVWSVSLTDESARLAARDIRYTPQGLVFSVVERGSAVETLATGLIGDYNVANLLGVIATLRAFGAPLADAVAACRKLDSVPGRMEGVAEPGWPLAVIDYAHTPDALDKALAGLRPLVRQRGGQLWCVFGCGGDRDPVKRPMMAAVAEKQANRVVVTSDNPRSEAPNAIISQILLGLSAPKAASVEVDRALAIAGTLRDAAPADVVLIAGRGHEAWQEVAGERIAFSDRSHVVDAMQRGRAA